MAIRRSGARDGEREYDDEPEERGFAWISGDVDPGPAPWQDFIQQFNPDDLVPIAGNTEPGKGFPKAPTSVGPRQEPTPSAPSKPSAPDFNLPQGVTVDEGMFSGVESGGNSMASPAMPSEPTPLAMGTQNPIQNPPEGGTNRGPMRRSQQSPSLFAQSNSPMLKGRAGGLLGGGLGSTGGSDASGPLEPTEMFQKLLQMFKQG